MQVIGLGILLVALPLALATQEEETVSVEDVSPFIPPVPNVDLDLDMDLKIGNEESSDSHDTDASKVCSMGIKCGKDSGVRVELPVQGIMGADGPPGEPGPPGPAGVPGPPGESWRNDCDVAFYVGLSASHDFSYLTSDAPLVFDKVVTNRGGAYVALTGKFRAPFEGTYVFYVTVSAQEEQKGAVKAYLNGTFLGTVWAESFNDWGSASNTYVLDLSPGDEVSLMVLEAAHKLYAGMYTSFSGMCLWRNDLEVS